MAKCFKGTRSAKDVASSESKRPEVVGSMGIGEGSINFEKLLIVIFLPYYIYSLCYRKLFLKFNSVVYLSRTQYIAVLERIQKG